MPISGLSASAVTRTRMIPVARPALWEIISDPHHQPRWWPGVERVEAVTETGFTQVLRTKKGRPVRVDFTVRRWAPPASLSWRKELEGSPFPRVLTESAVHLELSELQVGSWGTTVSITHEQRLRGSSRTGGFMLRRATITRLDAILTGLAEVAASQ